MRHSTMYVGLDYHQDSVQVCGLDERAGQHVNRRCANDWRAICQAVGEAVPVIAAIEASTGAADLAEQLADRAGWTVHLAHAQYVARLKQSPDKSDYSDARLLADLNRVGYLPRLWLPPAAIRELRRLVGYRCQLVEQRRATKLRVRALLRDHRINDAPASAWTKAWLGWALGHPKLRDDSRWLMEQYMATLTLLAGQIARVESRLRRLWHEMQTV